MTLIKEQDTPDVLMVLEHPPVFTLGRRGKEKNLLVSRAVLQQEEIPLIRCERGGGDITYHGPGQLVAYPIVQLKRFNLGTKDYVFRLEEVSIRSFKDRSDGKRPRSFLGCLDFGDPR